MVFGKDEFAGALDFDFEDERILVVNYNYGVVDTVVGVAVEAEVVGDEAFVEVLRNRCNICLLLLPSHSFQILYFSNDVYGTKYMFRLALVHAT